MRPTHRQVALECLSTGVRSRSREPITKDARRGLLFDDAPATKDLEIAALRYLDRLLPNDWQERSPRGPTHHSRDIARANRATGLTAPEQRSKGSFDASFRRDRSRRKPPGVTTFAEGNLRIVHTTATSSEFELVLCSSNRATGSHQLIDELLPEISRDAGIGAPPPSTLNNDKGGLRRMNG